jgi:hypothetical protein
MSLLFLIDKSMDYFKLDYGFLKSAAIDALLQVGRRQQNGVCCAGNLGQARTLPLP